MSAEVFAALAKVTKSAGVYEVTIEFHGKPAVIKVQRDPIERMVTVTVPPALSL